MSKKLTQQEIIKRFKKVHGNIYDYFQVNYISGKKKVNIICKKHGIFLKSPQNHLKGQGCHECSKKKVGDDHRKIKNLEEMIKKFINLDFSEFIYKTVHIKGKITCKKCGIIFYDSITNLKQKNTDCMYCSPKGRTKYTLKNLINKFIKIHGNKYIYDKVELKKQNETIEIICKTHGSFFTNINSHLSGHGCIKCNIEKNKLQYLKPQEEFIQQCKDIHNNYYDYSKINYQGMFSSIIIICPKHGEFEQLASSHHKGHGCKRCKESKGEEKIFKFLNDNNIKFESQKSFKNCQLKRHGKLRFDFFIPEKQMCIEYQGAQHYIPIKYWRGEKGLVDQQLKDQYKFEYCKHNNIKFIEIPYWEQNNIEQILQKELGL